MSDYIDSKFATQDDSNRESEAGKGDVAAALIYESSDSGDAEEE